MSLQPGGDRAGNSSLKGIAAFLLCFSAAVGSLAYLASHEVSRVGLSSPLGFVSALPTGLWIAAGIAVAASALILLRANTVRSQWVAFVPPLLMAGFLWGVPTLAEETIRHQDSYWHMSTALKIQQDGTFGGTQSIYGQWPGLFIVGVSLLDATELSPASVMRGFGLFGPLLFSLFVFTLALKTSSSWRAAMVATMVAQASAFYFEFHWSPHSVGVLLALAAMLAFSIEGFSTRILSLLLLLALVVTHPITPIFLSGILVGASGIAYVIPRGRVPIRTTYTYGALTLLILLVAYVGWLVYTATAGFSQFAHIGQQFLATIRDIAVVSAVGDAYATRSTVGNVRKIIFGVVVALGVATIVREFFVHKMQSFRPLEWIIASAFLAPAAAIVLSPLLVSSGDFNPRAIIWVMVGASVLSARLLAAVRAPRGGARIAGAIAFTGLVVLASALPTAEEAALLPPASTNAAATFAATAIGTDDTIGSVFLAGQYVYYNLSLTRAAHTVWDSLKEDPQSLMEEATLFHVRPDSRAKVELTFQAYSEQLEWLETTIQGSPSHAKIFDAGDSELYRGSA